MEIIQKGYGELRLMDAPEPLVGEITLHAEGWVAVTPMQSSDEKETRWFPNHRVIEVLWSKKVAMSQGRR